MLPGLPVVRQVVQFGLHSFPKTTVDQSHFDCQIFPGQSQLECRQRQFSPGEPIEIVQWPSPALKCKSTATIRAGSTGVISPYFLGDYADVQKFLSSVRGAKPQENYQIAEEMRYTFMMSHDHLHHERGHAHAPNSFGPAFAIGAALNFGLVIAELVFGYLSNSLALVSDGVHNLSDVLGLLLAWTGSWLATRQPSASRTYGYRRASILAALGNASLLLIATGGLLGEAVQRLSNAPPVASGTVLWVASVAIAINTATALLFLRGREHDLNIRGAFLHMAGDAAVSLGVVVAALIIGQTGWLWLDPAASIAVAIAILWSGWGLMRDALNLALDAVPAGIDRTAVEAYLAGLPGVIEVHDLHIWGMSTTETALTAHLVRPASQLDDQFLADIAHELKHRFRIHHATIQIEAGDGECRLAPARVV